MLFNTKTETLVQNNMKTTFSIQNKNTPKPNLNIVLNVYI